VDDLVNGILLASEVPEAEGQVFNLGNDREIRIRELAELIRDLSGSTSRIVFVPYEDYYGQRFEDTPRRVPDLTRARSVLGYRPQVDLEEGLRRTIAWCRTNGFLARRSRAAVEA
jgi:UDP-glucose 4-epimerase